jgi:hypothetical protein
MMEDVVPITLSAIVIVGYMAFIIWGTYKWLRRSEK